MNRRAHAATAAPLSLKRPIDMRLTPETLRANQDIRDMLWPFDFAVTSNKEYGPVWFDTAPLQPFEIVAQRGSGCVTR
jgi:hypothetical protein